LKRISFTEILKHNYFPFLIFGIAILVVNLLAPFPIGDDRFFTTKQAFDWSYLQRRYYSWSSRLIIEFFLVGFLNLPSIIWRVVNSIVLVFLGISISQLFIEKNKLRTNWIVVSLLFIYPYWEMLSGGWFTVSINYLWPLSFGLFSLITLKKILFQNKIRLIEYIIGILFLVFSINQEIMAVVLLLVYLAAGIYLYIKKRPHWFVFLSLALCIGSLIFTLTAPGNINRRDVETHWFIDFNDISMIEKIEIGFSSTLSQYIFNFNIIFFLLNLLLLLSMFSKYQEPLFKIISLIPFSLILIFGNGFSVIVDRLFPHLKYIDTDISKYGLITLGNFTTLQSYIPLFLLFLGALSIITLIYLEFENSWKSIIAIGILVLGFISRMVLSFSPTVYASGLRTHFLFYISIIICSVLVFQSLSNRKSQQFMDNLTIIIGIIGGFSFLDLLYSL